MGIRGNVRRDFKHRILRAGESIRADGKYQLKYYVDGKPHFVYSWKLEPTDTLPQGKKPCLSLREMEKQIGYDLDAMVDPQQKNITVLALVERYLKTKTGTKPQTKSNYRFVVNILKNEPFSGKKICGALKLSGRYFTITPTSDTLFSSAQELSAIKIIRSSKMTRKI